MNSETERGIETMNGAEPTLTEQAPIPLALARVQRGPKPPPRVRRAARPSLPLVRLEESVAMGFAKQDSDDNDNIEDSYEIVETPSPMHRRASAVPTPCKKTSNSISFFARKGLETRRASLAAPLCHPVDMDKVRRPSWAVRLQLERKKRRKSGDDEEVETVDEDEVATPPAASMRRRQSWWNVLVPENILKNRSRRASQQLSRSDENIVQTQKRSKSRSVDHGFAAPFDLDSLRSKVEGRFDSVHREEDESSKRSSISSQTPSIKTISYVVRDRETLTSLAARFDTTPSELTKINRLATPYIFPGQTLLVPEKIRDGDKDSDNPSESGDGNSDSGPQSTEPQEKELLENLRPVSPEAPSSPAAPQRFLKINVRHITDGQGVVSGVLLVTPNAVMFDPNVSDFLVIEHGPELYGVIAPMEFVVNAAIYFDIAHMRTHDSDPSAHKGEKPEIYYMNQSNPEDKDSTLLKDETFSELHEASEQESKEDEESEVNLSKDKITDDSERGGDAFPKAFDRELVTPTEKHNAEERRKSMLDHHWAIPLKARNSVDMNSEASSTTAENNREDSFGEGGVPSSNLSSLIPPGTGDLPSLHLVKLSCHDSGIDIRDPMLNITPSNTKKVYSDADIVLSSDWVPPVTIAPAEAPLSAPPHSGPGNERPPTGRKPGSVSFSLDNGANNDSNSSKDDSKADKKNKMLKRLSYPLSWMEGLTGDNTSSGSQGDSLPTSADSHNSGSVFSKVFNRRSSLGGFGRSDPKKTPAPPQSNAPKLDYRSMVSVDDMPELFVSFDKLIPRLARSCNDPPLYLRLRMGRPIGKPLPRTTPLMSYGKKRMRPEYWFSVPRNRVDDLFKFLNHWVPDRYGELGDVTARGYQLVDSDTDWDEEEEGTTREKGERTDSQGDVGDLTRESWELLKAPYVKIYSILKSQGLSGDSDEHSRDEVLSMSDEVRRALYSSGASIDMEYSPPDLIGSTEILTMEHREKLCNVLPARAQGYMWSLVFNSSQHGFSLASMYRKMQRVDSPVLLIIQDTDNNVFGALTSKALHPSEHFYGTGESFLFSFAGSQSQPFSPTGQRSLSPLKKDFIKSAEGDLKLANDDEPAIIESSVSAPVSPIKSIFRYWQWTGENMYFIRGSNENISIGGGDGKFGLWLDGDLYLGRTQRCQTYENEPLTTREDFIVKILECWAFI